MNCPACANTMEEITIEGVCVDVCRRGCGGVWFDRFELQKMDESHESAGERLLEIEVNKSSRIDHTARRKCPKCADLILMRHFFSTKKQTEVDECPGCAGIWIDRGELKKIREQFTTEEDRDRAAREYFADEFSDDIEAMRQESEERLDKARRFAGLFRFICPTYYIPGKQKGGAF